MHTRLDNVAAQHILFKGGDEDERAIAAEAIKGKIEAGAMSFEDAARQFSECPSRAETPAGSLGSFAPGKMVAEFDAYIFNPMCAVPGACARKSRAHASVARQIEGRRDRRPNRLAISGPIPRQARRDPARGGPLARRDGVHRGWHLRDG